MKKTRKLMIIYSMLMFVVAAFIGSIVFESRPQVVLEKNEPVADEQHLIETEREKRLKEEREQAVELEEASKDRQFYEDIVVVTEALSNLVLVNKNYKLDASFSPNDLILPDVLDINYQFNSNLYLREVAALEVEKLFLAAYDEAELTLLARSGYRSYETQAQLHSRYVQESGQEAADWFSARPGHSEHQTGLALDVTAASVNRELVIAFGETKEGQWLKANAHRFGFIIRYPMGRELETGYQYEPWHIRYVGRDAAKEIFENDLILEDYLKLHEKR